MARPARLRELSGQFATQHSGYGIASTSWWVDFSNFFEGVGALGGGNVTLAAGNDIDNVDAVVPTNARISEDGTVFQELGGGNLSVSAGDDIDAGAYYVERGAGTLTAGNNINTNSTRDSDPEETGVSAYWLPTTLFLGGAGTPGGSASFQVSAGDSVCWSGSQSLPPAAKRVQFI